jgi:hypothetical protein
MEAMRPQQPSSVPVPNDSPASRPAAADADRGAGDSAPADTAAAAAQSSSEMGTGHPAADRDASAGGGRPAGLGSSALPRPSSGRSSAAQPAAPGGIGAGLGLPPRPAPARRRLSASQRSSSAAPSGTARAASDPEAGAPAPQSGQLGACNPYGNTLCDVICQVHPDSSSMAFPCSLCCDTRALSWQATCWRQCLAAPTMPLAAAAAALRRCLDRSHPRRPCSS